MKAAFLWLCFSGHTASVQTRWCLIWFVLILQQEDISRELSIKLSVCSNCVGSEHI